ncbi:triose-phosphate isomerase [Candidatus Woesearchaeota archaeon]|nr:triose-phosphate isomerase [Candidatus Woesearchaeota archaeon]
MLIINFKTYKQGESVIKLAKLIKKINKNIIIALQATDIYRVKKETNLQIYSQHVDHFEPGRNTGFILPEAIKSSGATGTFLNHSEHKLTFNILKQTIKRCKKLNLKTIVFAKDLEEAKKISKLKPNFIALEPPELIAGKISVSQSNPDLIKRAIQEIKRNILVGAGVNNKKDVQIAKKLGAKGILVSSAVLKSSNPKKIIRELL